MPDRFRKPRARRDTPTESAIDLQGLFELMRSAGDDESKWQKIERPFVRYGVSKGETVAEALRIFEAYRAAPYFLPRRPPKPQPLHPIK